MNPTPAHYLLSYVRGVICGVLVLFFIALYGSWLILLSVLFRKNARAIQDQILSRWGRGMAFLFNMRIEVFGLKNLSPRGVLFLFNHASHFDIPIFYAAIRKSARFGAKIELFSIPIFAQILKITGTLPITRSDRDKVLELYSKSIENVKKGESYTLAAEGTRQPQPGVGAQFKSGPLIFAITGQFEIQPIVIHGAYEVLPKTQLFPGLGRWVNPVKVSILPPVSTKGLTLNDRDQLKTQLRDMMTKEYNRLSV